MATNTLITPSDVVRDASLFLRDQLIMGNLVNRKTESRFVSKVGDSVEVTVPPTIVAKKKKAGVNTTGSAVTETSVDVVIEEHIYVRVDLTSDELTLELDNFNEVITLPTMRAIVADVEAYLLRKAVGGYISNLVGTQGTNPSTHAHILAAENSIFANKGDVTNLVSVITGTAHSNLAQLKIFSSAEYGPERPDGLRTNSLGKLGNMSFFRSPYAGAMPVGDTGGSVLVKGDPGTASVISMDAFTEATGTINEGLQFTCASDTSGNIYTVTADVDLVGNEALSIPITPAADASIADNDAVTFQTPPQENVVFNPISMTAAILPGAVVGHNAVAENIGGLGVRIINDVDVDTLNGVWVFDLYIGAKAVRTQFGSVMQGG